uniref:Heat shock protein 70 n=1 Tax=Panagrolaimus sp. JU765 TaxID=591449 RepID=A0AC34RB68_9BILA
MKHDITQEDQISVDMCDLGSKIQNDLVLKKKVVDDIFSNDLVKRFVLCLPFRSEESTVDLIFLAGGTSRISIFHDSIKQKFPNAKIIMDGEVEVITATGAAIHGLQILNKEIEPFTEFQRFKNFEYKESIQKEAKIDESMKHSKITENSTKATLMANRILCKNLLPEK